MKKLMDFFNNSVYAPILFAILWAWMIVEIVCEIWRAR